MAKPTKHYDKWRIRWVDDLGVRQSAVFETYNEASHQLRQFQVSAEEIRRGLKSPMVAKKTFSDVCDYWIKNRAAGKRSGSDDVSIIRCHLRPTFGDMTLVHLTSEKIDELRESRSHLSAKTIHNILTLLISLLNQAKRLKWLAEVPAVHKPKVKLFDKDFTFLKSADEVAGFLNCARTYSQQGFVLYAVAIYTGLRQGELAGLKWSDVDLDRRIITVQRSFTGPTKSGSPRYVPITTALLPILRHWRLKVFGELVFQNAVGKMLHSNCNLFTTDFKACLRAAGFSDKIKKGKTRSYMVFHDLRHTFASQWVMAGGDIFKLQKIMGHESVQMTMRYAHLSPDAFAADFELFNKIAVPVNPGVAIQFPLEITC